MQGGTGPGPEPDADGARALLECVILYVNTYLYKMQNALMSSLSFHSIWVPLDFRSKLYLSLEEAGDQRLGLEGLARDG